MSAECWLLLVLLVFARCRCWKRLDRSYEMSELASSGEVVGYDGVT